MAGSADRTCVAVALFFLGLCVFLFFSWVFSRCFFVGFSCFFSLETPLRSLKGRKGRIFLLWLLLAASDSARVAMMAALGAALWKRAKDGWVQDGDSRLVLLGFGGFLMVFRLFFFLGLFCFCFYFKCFL